MTERHEITSMIEALDAVIVEAKYEANTKPGEDDEFKLALQSAIANIRFAITYLRLAERVRPDLGG